MDGADTGPITIVIADDHQVIRAALRFFLSQQDGFEVVGEAGDVATTERRVAAFRPRVLILDLNMPGEPTLPAIYGIRQSVPETRIVVLTMETDPASAREALQAGAVGYVLKEGADTELVQAVRLAAAGRTYVAPELGGRLVDEPQGAPDGLSKREVEVLTLIALGHTNAEIASKLYLSVRTVESHRARIHHKLRTSTRAELVRYALDRHLIGA